MAAINQKGCEGFHAHPNRQIHGRHHRQPDCQGDCRLAFEIGDFARAFNFALVDLVLRGCHHLNRLCRREHRSDRVSGFLDRAPEQIEIRLRRIKRDGRLFGREVDIGAVNSGDLAEGLFNSTHARGAGHTLDRQRDLTVDRVQSGGRFRRVNDDFADAIAGSFHRGAQIIDGGGFRVVRNRRVFGGQVDACLAHTRCLAERLFDAAHTRRAGHASNRQGDLRCIRARGQCLDCGAVCRHKIGWSRDQYQVVIIPRVGILT